VTLMRPLTGADEERVQREWFRFVALLRDDTGTE
jgi:hypothetical protein